MCQCPGPEEGVPRDISGSNLKKLKLALSSFIDFWPGWASEKNKKYEKFVKCLFLPDLPNLKVII